MIPYKCPKCNGVGWLPYDPLNPFGELTMKAGPWKCPICKDGVIWQYEQPQITWPQQMWPPWSW